MTASHVDRVRSHNSVSQSISPEHDPLTHPVVQLEPSHDEATVCDDLDTAIDWVLKTITEYLAYRCHHPDVLSPDENALPTTPRLSRTVTRIEGVV